MHEQTVNKIWKFTEEDVEEKAPSAEQLQAGTESKDTDAVSGPPFCQKQNVLKVGKRHLDSHLVSLVDPFSPEVEKYRTLRYHVEKMSKNLSGCVAAVTSPIAGDGKSMTAINLAGTLAQNTASSVLLLELDLHQPGNSMKDYLGIKKLKEGAGVVDWVANPKVTLEQATYFLPKFNLYVMPSGSPVQNPYELVKSPRFGELIEATRDHFDFVIIDTAPAALVAESRLLSQWVDGFLIVVAADITPKEMLAETLNTMDPEKVTGIVFNRYSSSLDKYYGYY